MQISNIDSLFFSVDIKDYEKNNQELIQLLELYKLQAKADTLQDTYVDYKTYRFKIMPNGLRFHSFILHNEIISISISSHRSANKENYPVAVRLKSLFLWQKGYLQAYEDSINILKDIFKGEFISEKISRADICCHTDSLQLNLEDVNSFRGTFKKNEIFMTNRKLSGLTFGTFTEKNVMLRIYNKSLEIKQSGKTWFNSIWEKQSMNIDNVWNVEYQIGRSFFKEHNIESVADFAVKSRSIWEQLTQTYCCYINLDNDNISRCSIKSEWLEIIQAYNEYIKQDLIKRDKQMRCTADELLPLLTGVLISYGACKYNFSLQDVLQDFNNDLSEYLKTKKGNADLSDLLLKRSQYIHS
ncbi:hypothetical protein [Sedimentibacter sp.]|uniref:hypothetical protein n=1 Tax=Sedimentibacter sp. TaxID=1960295 RepID=UPI00289A443B|nr:hypothetical protein [Sedimentibacter sp.]